MQPQDYNNTNTTQILRDPTVETIQQAQLRLRRKIAEQTPSDLNESVNINPQIIEDMHESYRDFDQSHQRFTEEVHKHIDDIKENVEENKRNVEEAFKDYVADHQSWLPLTLINLYTWLSTTPWNKWCFIIGISSILGVSTIVVLRYLWCRVAPSLPPVPAAPVTPPVRTDRFFWGLYERTVPVTPSQPDNYNTFTAIQDIIKGLKFLFSKK